MRLFRADINDLTSAPIAICAGIIYINIHIMCICAHVYIQMYVFMCR